MKNVKFILAIMILLLVKNIFAQINDQIKNFEENIYELNFSSEGIRQTENTFSIYNRMEHYNVPGLSIAFIEKNKIEWTREYGFLEAGSDKAVNEKTIFQTASVSKFVASVLILHYVDKGILDLDKDINSYLKSWKIPENEFNKNKTITLRHILSHTSGLPSFPMFERDTSDNEPTVIQVLNGEHPALNPPAVCTFEPGDHWAYSNIGYAVLQILLEDITGMSINEIADEVLFKPLQMKSSSFNYPLPITWQKREAKPHATDGALRDPVIDPTKTIGGFLSTPSDMAKLVIEVMKSYQGESDKLLTQETVNNMFKTVAPIPPEALGLPLNMGLGVLLDNETENFAILHPGHSYPGTVFVFFAFPKQKSGVVVAANGNIGDRLYLEIIATLADKYGWSKGQYFK